MLQLNDDGVLEKVDEEKLVTVDEEELDELINRYDELHKRNEQLNENNLHYTHFYMYVRPEIFLEFQNSFH